MWIELTSAYSNKKVMFNLNHIEVITEVEDSNGKGKVNLFIASDPHNPFPVSESYETVKSIVGRKGGGF